MINKLQDAPNFLSAVNQTEPIVLCAADDNYVRPLAVMLQSAAKNLSSGSNMKVIVLDGGISDEHWVGLKETLADLPIEICSIRPTLEDVETLGISHHITHTAYLRLLAGRLLPETIEKVIYLDSDCLVCDDITKLWNLPLDGKFALAVQDIACPFVDMRYADCNFKKSNPYLAALSPIANWRELGIDPAAPYFNSGVMVLNIARMRDEKIERKLLDCLTNNEKHVWCWDQYALNVVFVGQWKPLPLRWNQGAHVFEFPGQEHSPLNAVEFCQARENPAIVHFTTEWKPWDFDNRHPLRHLFFEQLDQTAWRGWRPERPEFSLGNVWQRFATEFVKHWVIHYRKFISFFRKGKFSRTANELPETVSPLFGKTTRVFPSTELHHQLTIFAIPKKFEGAADIAQRNAINSWKRLSPFTDIVLLGDDPGTAEAAKELGVAHVSGVAKNQAGTPILSSAFELARKHSAAPYLAYCNSDVILFDDFSRAIERLILNPDIDQFLATGQRTDLKLEKPVDFESVEQVEDLKSLVRRQGRLESLVCKEFFVFPRHLFGELPDFLVGRGNWDNWMIHRAKQWKIPVVSISDCVLVLHQSHDHSHAGGILNCYVRGNEARNNQELASGRHLISGSTCDLRLGNSSLRPSRMRSVNGEFWMDFPRFARLLMKFVGLR